MTTFLVSAVAEHSTLYSTNNTLLLKAFVPQTDLKTVCAEHDKANGETYCLQGDCNGAQVFQSQACQLTSTSIGLTLIHISPHPTASARFARYRPGMTTLVTNRVPLSPVFVTSHLLLHPSHSRNYRCF